MRQDLGTDHRFHDVKNRPLLNDREQAGSLEVLARNYLLDLPAVFHGGYDSGQTRLEGLVLEQVGQSLPYLRVAGSLVDNRPDLINEGLKILRGQDIFENKITVPQKPRALIGRQPLRKRFHHVVESD